MDFALGQGKGTHTLRLWSRVTTPLPQCLRRGLGRGVRLLYTKDTSCNRVYFMVFGLWSLVSGLWSLVSGLWSLVSGLWSLVSGLWSLVFGLWSLVSGLLVSGLWSLVSGLWSLVSGLWSLGLWSLVSIAPSTSFLFFNLIVCGNWISLPKFSLPMYICGVNVIPKL